MLLSPTDHEEAAQLSWRFHWVQAKRLFCRSGVADCLSVTHGNARLIQFQPRKAIYRHFGYESK
jgi:hypothetical protein